MHAPSWEFVAVVVLFLIQSFRIYRLRNYTHRHFLKVKDALVEIRRDIIKEPHA